MPVQVTCNHCRKQIKVPDHLSGVSVKCPNCKAPLPVASPPDDPYLADLLQAAAASTQAPTMPRAQSASPFASGPRPKARSTPAWKRGALPSVLKDNAWTIITLLSTLPYTVMIGSPLVLIPGVIFAAFVFISEWGRRNHGNEDGMNTVDRILLGISVGLSVSIVILALVCGFLPKPVGNNQAQVPFWVLALSCVIWLLLQTPGWLISYVLARAFGLGRSYAFVYMVFGLIVIVLLISLPPGFARQPFLAAQAAARNAQQPNGGVQGEPFPPAGPQMVGGPPAGPQIAPQQQPRFEPRPQQPQGNPPAEFVPPQRHRMGAGMLAQDGLKELDFRDRLKHAFAWDKATTRGLLAARLITSDDNDFVAGALRRAPALGQATMNVYFMLGITGLDRPSRNGTDWGEQKGAEGDYRRAAGDAGMLLLDGLMTRVAHGSFGDWGCDVQLPQESDPRAVLFSIADSEDFLRTFAAQQNVDVLISLNMTSKLAVSKKKRNQIVTLVVRVIDVASDAELWASKPLTSTAIASGRAKGADPSIEVVNDLLEYCDQNLALEPEPPMTAAAANEEADRLTADRAGDPLLKLATLRVFQCQGLIPADKTIEYAGRILHHDDAPGFASDEPLERLDAISGLIPKR